MEIDEDQRNLTKDQQQLMWSHVQNAHQCLFEKLLQEFSKKQFIPRSRIPGRFPLETMCFMRNLAGNSRNTAPGIIDLDGNRFCQSRLKIIFENIISRGSFS